MQFLEISYMLIIPRIGKPHAVSGPMAGYISFRLLDRF